MTGLLVALLLVVGVVGVLRVEAARRVVRPDDARAVPQPMLTDESSVSYHGDDIGIVEPVEPRVFTVCDLEADVNPVRGEVEYYVEDPVPAFATIRVDEIDGAGGTCTRITAPALITRHRVCERNHLVWVCGNWMAAI